MKPADRAAQVISLDGNAVTADFFAMFDVPFRFGSGWAANDDAPHAAVAVISQD